MDTILQALAAKRGRRDLNDFNIHNFTCMHNLSLLQDTEHTEVSKTYGQTQTRQYIIRATLVLFANINNAPWEKDKNRLFRPIKCWQIDSLTTTSCSSKCQSKYPSTKAHFMQRQNIGLYIC